MAIRIECNNGYFGQTYISSDGTSVFVERGLDFDLLKVFLDEDTGNIHYRVGCTKLGMNTQFDISKKEAIDGKRVQEYACKGLDVTASNKLVVNEVFSIKEIEYVEDGNTVFPVHSIAGIKKVTDSTGKESYVYAGYTNPLTGSEYIGHLNLKPVGNKESWFAFVKEEIKDSIEIAFIISLSFAAILHSVLKDETDIDNFIVHLRGDSSSGKTTMLCLAASVFGPGTDKDPNGIISSWNATANALLRRMMNVNGILMGLDEVSMNQEKNFTHLLYRICGGVEKDRLTKEAEVQARLVGSYILLSTGEASLLAKTNGNIGLSMRVFEFDSHQWSKSAQQAERIKRFCKRNSGHASSEFGLRLYQLILEQGIDSVYADYEKWRQHYCETCEIQARKERMSGRYALILLAAQYANQFFDMHINELDLCDFIIRNENSNDDDRDNYGDFYNKIVAFIIMNRQHFDDEARHVGINRNHGIATVEQELKKHVALEPWGMFTNLPHGHQLTTGDVSHKTVSITEVMFDKIVMKELGYEDPKALRKFLNEKGLSVCEKGRNDGRKMFRGTKTKMVTIYLPTDDKLDPKELEWLAKEKIKANLKKLEDMKALGFSERSQLLKELEERKEYMSSTEAAKYERVQKQRETMKKLRILLDEEDD